MKSEEAGAFKWWLLRNHSEEILDADVYRDGAGEWRIEVLGATSERLAELHAEWKASLTPAKAQELAYKTKLVPVTCPWCGNEVGPVRERREKEAVATQDIRDQPDREAAGRFWATLDRTVFPLLAFDPERFCDDCWQPVVYLGTQLRRTYTGENSEG